MACLDELAPKIKEEWANPVDTHTRYFVIDELLPTETAQAIYDAFPRNAEGFFDPDCGHLRNARSTGVAKVAELVGFQQIVPDPSLYAGGLSMMFQGDILTPHIDNSHGASRDIYRRLNLPYYVVPDWKLENGNNFELWDHEVKKQKKPSFLNSIALL